jgi:Asp-tRNA(Asn)/Glu-tRNA(Gln) amidotransferase A subunit family amidase
MFLIKKGKRIEIAMRAGVRCSPSVIYQKLALRSKVIEHLLEVLNNFDPKAESGLNSKAEAEGETIDFMLSYGFVTPATKIGKTDKSVTQVFYTACWNFCGFPVCVLPVTKVLKHE